LPLCKEPDFFFFFLLEPPDPFFFLSSKESLALLLNWLSMLLEDKENCREGLVALGKSSSETFYTLIFLTSASIQSSHMAKELG
jgi:hypothetical protein